MYLLIVHSYRRVIHNEHCPELHGTVWLGRDARR